MDGISDAQESNPVTPDVVAPQPRWLQIFNRIFCRHLMSMAVIATVVVILSGTLQKPQNLVHDPDLWWHLADARILTTTHHFIRMEPYSFTVAGQRWVNPEWLGELPYWFGYRIGSLAGLYLVTEIGLLANIFLLYWRGYWRSGHSGAAFWATGICFMLMTVNAGPRIIVLAYILMSLEMAILEAADRGDTRWLWFLPPIFCIWVNTHGSWLIGLGLLVLHVLCGLIPVHAGVFNQEAFPATTRKTLLWVLAACVVVLIINPYGWRLMWNPIDMMVNQKLNIQNVQEWQPLNLERLAGKVAAGCIAAMVIANGVSGRKWRLFEIAVVFFAWYSAFDHARFLFMAAVLTAPMLAQDLERDLFLESDKKTIPAMNLLMVAGSIWVLVHFFPSQASFDKGLKEAFPLQTIASIQPQWRTMNSDGLGGIMDFEGKPTFLDSRFDTFEHHGVLKDFLDIVYSRAPLQLFDKYKIDHVLLWQTQPLAYWLSHTPGWKLARTEGTGDNTFVLFERAAPAAPDQNRSAPVPPVPAH
ncbi:MAG: hypothetical protein KGJ51_02650 [Acidobacteriota bacterium]|nr:hypothetical protein [Acidobacteriota bacterium]